MKQLIVNADDFGADAARNDGIGEGLHAGVITSVSVLANGPAIGDVSRRFASLFRKSISWGLHLNLSEGKPACSSLSCLVGADGFFRGKQAAQDLLGRAASRKLQKEIRLEIRAQIKVLQEHGIPISHLDGHQHIHICPAVIRPVLEAVRENGIPWMRLPEEPPPRRIPSAMRGLCDEAARFNALAGQARLCLTGATVRTSIHFRGLYLKDRLTRQRLVGLLACLPDGLTELMVHPGRATGETFAGPFAAFASEQRTAELDALMSPSFRRALAQYEIELTPFPEKTR